MNLDALMNKHLTRYFDPGRTIPEDTLQQLLRFLRSTPSSVNVQPNHFYVLATPKENSGSPTTWASASRTTPRKFSTPRTPSSSPPARTFPTATSRRCSRRSGPTAGSRTRRSSSGGRR
ncbi:nitroreductase family protein [Pseudonocardia benzenivorans]